MNDLKTDKNTQKSQSTTKKLGWHNRSETNLDVVCFDYCDQTDISKFNEVYIWDLDKTYLDTKIDSFKGLLATVFEKTLAKKMYLEHLNLLKVYLDIVKSISKKILSRCFSFQPLHHKWNPRYLKNFSWMASVRL